MTEYTIKHRWTGAVLYTGGGETLRDVIVAAVKGSLAEFRAACAETHGDGIHGREYAAAIHLIETHAALWMPAAEQPQEAAA